MRVKALQIAELLFFKMIVLSDLLTSKSHLILFFIDFTRIRWFLFEKNMYFLAVANTCLFYDYIYFSYFETLMPALIIIIFYTAVYITPYNSY